jgi:hypothetical protein
MWADDGISSTRGRLLPEQTRHARPRILSVACRPGGPPIFAKSCLLPPAARRPTMLYDINLWSAFFFFCHKTHSSFSPFGKIDIRV